MDHNKIIYRSSCQVSKDGCFVLQNHQCHFYDYSILQIIKFFTLSQTTTVFTITFTHSFTNITLQLNSRNNKTTLFLLRFLSLVKWDQVIQYYKKNCVGEKDRFLCSLFKSASFYMYDFTIFARTQKFVCDTFFLIDRRIFSAFLHQKAYVSAHEFLGPLEKNKVIQNRKMQLQRVSVALESKCRL